MGAYAGCGSKVGGASESCSITVPTWAGTYNTVYFAGGQPNQAVATSGAVTAPLPPSPPVNDHVAVAQAIGVSSPVTGTNEGASTEAGSAEPASCQGASFGQSVWYRPTPNQHGNVTLSLGFQSDDLFSASLAVCDGSALSQLAQVNCNQEGATAGCHQRRRELSRARGRLPAAHPAASSCAARAPPDRVGRWRRRSAWRSITVPMRCAALLLVLLLSACGGQPAASPSPAAGGPAGPSASEAPRAGAARPAGGRTVILATTTSTQDSGLLDVLVPLFERQGRWQVKTVSVGTGAALALGARGEADVVLVHAPKAEEQWMAQGYGTERLLVMHNDFLVVGPPADPARVKGQASAVRALREIAARQAPWVSRDDNSGTDQLEKQLWRDAGINPQGQSWYVTSGQGMGATLTLADQKGAYTLTDRATYLARRSTLQAVIVVEGDMALLNIYHVMPVNPAKFPQAGINAQGGKAFADFLVAPETQQVIANFGRDKYGQPLFFADAGKTL